ncbi:ATP-binding protein [Streptomyces pathocidini]|uniref:ATP-binding protein n=1 Tax=Streptomyces pathocidini TaxID=1650571 RepID=UPI0033C20F67
MTATRPTRIGAPGYTESLPCEAESARRARLLVSTALHTWGLPGLIETGTLLASELVTNAIRHSGSRSVHVSISRLTGDVVRIATTDGSPGMPAAHDAEADDEGGRGLALVDTLADRWGTDLRPRGKTMWAELTAGER